MTEFVTSNDCNSLFVIKTKFREIAEISMLDFKFYQISYIIYLEFETFLGDLSWSIAVIRGHLRSFSVFRGQICFVRTENPGSIDPFFGSVQFSIKMSKIRQSYLLI